MDKWTNRILTAISVAALSFLSLQLITEVIAYIKVPPPPPPTVTEEGGNFLITYQWNYSGRKYTYEDRVPKNFYSYYRNKLRIPPFNYETFIEDPYDDSWLSSLANNLWNLEPFFSEEKKLSLILSFVQYIPYQSDKETTGREDYPRYPVETIVDGRGDCEDKAILFASLCRALGYKVILLLYPKEEHVAVAIKVPWAGKVDHYEVGGENYAFCETTQPGWKIGEKPKSLVSNPWIIIVH